MCYRLHRIITLGENVRFPKCWNCNGYTCQRNCVEELNAKVIIEIGNKYTWAITPSDCLKRHFSMIAVPKHFNKEHEEEIKRKLNSLGFHDTELPTTRPFCLFCNPFQLFNETKKFIRLHSYLSFTKSNSIYQKLINGYCTDTVQILGIPNIEVFSPAEALLNSGTFLILKIFLDHLFHKMDLNVTLKKPNAVLMLCEPLAINPALRKQLLHYLFQEVKIARYFCYV